MGLFSKDQPQNTPTTVSKARPATAPVRKAAESRQANTSSTTLARGSHMEGVLSGTPDLQINGGFVGEINVSGSLTVGDSGMVKAEVRARSIVVSGRIEGNLSADDRIELEASATVVGNLLSPRILIRDGASLQGAVEMSAPKAATEKKVKAEKPGSQASSSGRPAQGGKKSSGK